MRKAMLLALAALVLPLAGCDALEFKEFSSAEGKFSVLMPGTPVKQKTLTPKGVTLVAHAVNVANGIYSVAYADVPAGTPLSLSAAVRGIANTIGGKVLSEKEYTFAGKTGREFEIEATEPKGYVSGRVIVINGRFYEIRALETDARLSSADVQTFLNSFKLTK